MLAPGAPCWGNWVLNQGLGDSPAWQWLAVKMSIGNPRWLGDPIAAVHDAARKRLDSGDEAGDYL
jgi:hypothetical protein